MQADTEQRAENCAHQGKAGWYDIPCSSQEIACVCEKGLTTTKAFTKWQGPTLDYFVFEIQGRRSAREPLYGIAIVLGILSAIGGFLYMALNENYTDVTGNFFPLALFAVGQFFIPGCLLLMAAFLGSDAANCRDDDPIPMVLAGRLGILLCFVVILVGKVQEMRDESKKLKSANEAQKRSLIRQDTMQTHRTTIEDRMPVADPSAYINHVAEMNRTVDDAITGNKLQVDTQTILIGVNPRGAQAQQYKPMNRTLLACLFLFFPYLLTVHFLLFSNLVWDSISAREYDANESISRRRKRALFASFTYGSIMLQWFSLQVIVHFILRLRVNAPRKIHVKSAGSDAFVEGILLNKRSRCEVILEDGTRQGLWVWLLKNFRTKTLLVPEEILIGQSRPEFTAVKDVKELLELMLSQGDDQPPILIRAKAGTGKTWSARQLVRHLATHEGQNKMNAADRTIPMLIYVQGLVRELRNVSGKDISNFLRAHSLVELHINTAYRDQREFKEVLLDAFRRRQLLVVLDGVDEAADLSQMIEVFIFDQLIEQGHRVLVTSRYEGVQLDERYRDFVVMDLSPLSEDQQRDITRNQLGKNEHFEHLLQFSSIRSEHDRIYLSEAFSRERERDFVEEITSPDRFFLDGGQSEFDPSMRLHSYNDSARIVARNTTGIYKSEFLKKNTLNPMLLDELQGRIISLTEDVDDKAIEDEVEKLLPKDEEDSLQSKWLGKLGKLCLKFRKGPSDLWREIMERTDEIYLVAENLEPVFRRVIETLLHKSGMDPNTALTVGNLKDPIRSHEKALDDYSTRFKDSELAESCLADVIRFRVITSNADSLKAIQAHLMNGFEVEIDGSSAKLELIRVKNKFKHLDPTHFRNILENIRLQYQGRTFLAEIQLHHEKILRHNDKSDAHTHYNYFRSLMKDQYEDHLSRELDFMLETTMVVFEEIVKVPVLLSMFAVVLRSAKNEATKGTSMKLPTDVFALYASATDIVVKGAASKYEDATMSDSDIKRCLRTIAYQNHLMHRRIFSSNDVIRWLGDKAAMLDIWNKIIHFDDKPPLLKVLTVADADGQGGEYSFSHLSFQEFFFLETVQLQEGLPDGFHWETIDEKIEFFRRNFNDNVTRLGGTILATKLFSELHATELTFNKSFSSASQTLRLCRVLSNSGHQIRRLAITNCSFDDECLELLGRGLSMASSKVEVLDLHGNNLDDLQLKIALEAGLLRGNLKELLFTANMICGLTVDVLTEEVEKSQALKLLDFRGNLFCEVLNNTRAFDVLSIEARKKIRLVTTQKGIRLLLWCPLPPNRLKAFVFTSIISGGIVLGCWLTSWILFPLLFALGRTMHFTLDFFKGILRHCLKYSDDAPLWLPERPAVEHPVFKFGKLLHILLYPITYIMSLPTGLL